MKILKRSLALMLVLIMLLGTQSSVLAVSAEQHEDVAEGKYYAEYLHELTEVGIVKNADGLFWPDRACTRAEFVTWLWRAANSPAPKKACTLTDVEAGQDYSDAVAWAQENGIVTGYYDGSFGVNDTVTRAHMVTFLYRWGAYMKHYDMELRKDLTGYPDVKDIPSHAMESLSWAVADEILLGTTDGRLDPNGCATRAHAVAFLGRLLELSELEDLVIGKADELHSFARYTNVTVADTVKDGETTLEAVTIYGDLIIEGGGSNSVKLHNCIVHGKVIMRKQVSEEDAHEHQPPRLHLNNTPVKEVVVEEPAIIEAADKASDIGNLTVEAAVEIKGKGAAVEAVYVPAEAAANVEVKVTGGVVTSVTVESKAGLAVVEGTVETVIVKSEITLNVGENAAVNTVKAEAEVKVEAGKVSKVEIPETVTGAAIQITVETGAAVEDVSVNSDAGANITGEGTVGGVSAGEGVSTENITIKDEPVAHVHVWKTDAGSAVAATCEKDGKTFDVCMTEGCSEGTRETIIPALGHDWTDADCDTPRTCETCGATGGEALGHDWAGADCNTPKTCKTCGVTDGDALGHDWADADCDTPKTCKTCGATDGGALGHDWVDADCETPETCDNCGATAGDALGHAYGSWYADGDVHSCSCSGCGDQRSESHDYTNDEDTVCDTCGYERVIAHEHTFANTWSYDETNHWYASTCGHEVTSGLEAHHGGTATCEAKAVCTDCGQSYGELGDHAYGELIAAQSEVHTQSELKGGVAAHYICGGCGKYFTEGKVETDLAALTGAMPEHSYGDWVNTDAAKHWKACACGLESEDKEDHAWGDWELNNATGMYTHICGDCQRAQVLTRADLEQAVVDTAWAYYLKGSGVQYDSEAVDVVGKYYGGQYRVTENAAPEAATSHTDINSVCSDWILKIYLEALDYQMFGVSPLDATTTGMWLFCENQGDPALEESDIDSCLVRWKSSDFVFTNNTGKGQRDLDYGVDQAVYMTDDEAQAFMADWENNLRPGDVFVAMKGSGHALLYMGNGYVLDCSGDKYDTDLGIDQYELFGAVYKLTRVDEVFVNGTCPFFGNGEWVDEDGTLTNFILFRPTEFLVQSDDRAADGSIDSRAEVGTDGDLGNDPVIGDYPLPAASESRMKYPAMTIDRTVEITPYGTASTGEELTYSVKVTNHGNESFYTTYNTTYNNAESDFEPKAYEGLVITETVPEGTIFVSAANGGEEQDGTITWVVNVPVGETVEVTYTVKVTAAIGETITNDGGFVADIPSNSITNNVGGAKLEQNAQDVLAGIASTKPANWREALNLSKWTSDADFAERIYAMMGIQLELPTVEEMVKNLFTYNVDKTFRAIVRRYEGTTKTASVFELNSAAADVYADIQKMMVPNYVGGQKFYTGETARGTTICEFRNEYLEPGDIIIYVNTDTEGAVEDTRVMVWGPENTVISITSDLKTAAYKGSQAKQLLWKAFVQDLYFVLRPSQAVADINDSLYTGGEPEYDDEPSLEENGPTELGTTTLTPAQVSALQKLQAGDATGSYMKFAGAVYKKLGLDISGLYGSDTSILNVLPHVFEKVTENANDTTDRDYKLIENPSTDLGRMLIAGYWGPGDGEGEAGWLLDHSSRIGTPTPEMLVPGDIILLTDYYSASAKSYWTLVYQGNSKFLVSANYSGAIGNEAKGTQLEALDFSAADGKDPTYSITFAEFLKKDPKTGETWEFFFALRPSQAVYDIQDPSWEPEPQPEFGTSELSAEKLAVLAALKADDESWDTVEEYNTSKYRSYSFVWSIYADKLGTDISDALAAANVTSGSKITSNSAIMGEMFTRTYLDGEIRDYEYIEEKTTILDNMLITGYWGPAGVSKGEGWLMDHSSRIANPTLDMLKPGDIVLMTDLEKDSDNDFTAYWGAIYQGSGKFLISGYFNKAVKAPLNPTDKGTYIYQLDFSGGTEATFGLTYAEFLTKDLLTGNAYDFYLALRPSQAYYDINDTSYVPGEDVEGNQEPLSDENKAKLAALTADDAVATATRNAPFAEKIYQKIGLDFSSITGGNSMLNVMKQIFLIDGENLGNGFEYWYELMFEPAEGKEALHAMVVQEFMGGTHMNTEGMDIVENLSYTDLEVGDVVYMCIRNYSSYWIAVYQGDGKFLVSCYEGTKYSGIIYDGVTTITKGQNYWAQWDAKTASVDFLKRNPTMVAANAAGGEYIQDWQCIVVMRPSNAYADINVEAAMS